MAFTTKIWKARREANNIRLGETLKIDNSAGNTLWYDAIQKEMKKVRVAFKIIHADTDAPI
jgi:ribosomal protein L31E